MDGSTRVTRFIEGLRFSCLFMVCLGLTGCASLSGHSEEVTFRSGDGAALRGTLSLPEGVARPFPAVVLLHGAERAKRTGVAYRMHANVFLARGIAVLLYDKRGVGDSGGSYEDSTYAQLVDDGVAAVAYLRSRDEIDPSRIGLIGASESGWLTPEIAERSGGIRLIINKVGPAVSWRDTVAWEVFHDLQADGADEQSAREQADIFRRIWAYHLSPTPEGRAALEGVLSNWSGRKDSGLPAELGGWSESRIRDTSYDPSPFLERIEIPMLYVYGSEDKNVPTEICVARLEELAAAGKPVSFHVFVGEGHELGGPGIAPPFYKFAEGYAELLGSFAQTHLAP